ncbi:MAG: arylesterase [Kiritimatiellae bacterium]|jgi:acyl-CoA thioesterase-1|nr:arylesterase [Kiritimatiellia bacterium]
MKKIFKILFIGIMIICFGCGKPQIQPISDDSVIVAFGDSLTHGTGANSDETYPAVLSKLLDTEVINTGIPGEDTTEGLKRLPSVLKKYKPTLVILCHGGNDMLQKQNSQTTIKNINAMISMIQNSNCDVILVGVPRPALRLKTAKFYKEIAKQNKIPYQEKIITEVLSKPSLKSDRAHPNDEGYKLIAQSIFNLIDQSER